MVLGNSFPGPSGATDAVEARKAFAGLLTRDAAGVARSGVFPRGTAALTLVTARSDMKVDVAAFTAAAVRGGGPLFLANDATEAIAIDTAPAANKRIDIVYAVQHESGYGGFNDADNLAVFGVVKGTAAPSPVADEAGLGAIAGAIELARVEIPSTATATNSAGVVITQTFKYTSLTGTPFLVRSAAALPVAASWPQGQRARALDTDVVHVVQGTKWIPEQIYCVLRKSGNQALTVALAPLSWDVEVTDGGGMHDNASNNSRISAPVDGLYEFIVQGYNSNATGMGIVQARLNGTTDVPASFWRREANGSAGAALPFSTVFVVPLVAGDYVEIMVNHSTATGTIAGGVAAASATLTAKRLGPVA